MAAYLQKYYKECLHKMTASKSISIDSFEKCLHEFQYKHCTIFIDNLYALKECTFDDLLRASNVYMVLARMFTDEFIAKCLPSSQVFTVHDMGELHLKHVEFFDFTLRLLGAFVMESGDPVSFARYDFNELDLIKLAVEYLHELMRSVGWLHDRFQSVIVFCQE